jgi:hypothetical protein
MAGVFVGAGNWRLDFTADGVLVNCSFLSPDEHHYKLDFRNNLAVLTVDTTPKPLSILVQGDGTMSAPGPVVLDGVVASGSSTEGVYGTYRDQSGRVLSPSEAASSIGPVYDGSGNKVNPALLSHTTFVRRRATCPAINLSTKGAGVGVQTMQTDLLKTMFGGDKGPPTPPGIRMRGIFAASTGFSAQFFPESVVLGCGPDAARAYPYSVAAEGNKGVVKVEAPDHPLTLTFRPDGALDAGSGSYQVHGRVVIGQNDNDDFTFAPLEQTCNLAVLAPSKEIPSGGGLVTMSADNGRAILSTPDAPLGNATLSIVS